MRHNFKKKLLINFIVLASTLNPSDVFAINEKKILKIVPHVNLSILDPIWTSIYITRNHGYLIYDTLFALDINGNPKPQMIKDWSVTKDGLTWNFILRDGLSWHDNTPVTSEDCIASLKRWSSKDGEGQILMKNIVNIIKTDDRSFRVDFKKPYNEFLRLLAKDSTYVPFMMPKRVAETEPDKQISDYTGSGPFIFQNDKFRPGEKSVYLKNYNYRGRAEQSSYASGNKEAHVDEIDWVSFDTSAEAILALKNGDVDYLEAPDPKLISQITGNKKIVVSRTSSGGYVGVLRFNTTVPPFSDIAARRAIASVVEANNYMIYALGPAGLWTICAFDYPCIPNSGSEKKETYISTERISDAKKMLINSGYKGEKIVLLNATDMPVIDSFTKTTAKNLQLLGINVVIKNTTWSEMAQQRAIKSTEGKKTWNIFHSFWAASDISNSNSILFSTDPNNGWFGWPNNIAIELLREAYTFASNENERFAIRDKVRQYSKYETNYIPLGQFFLPVAYRSRVHGVVDASAQFYWTVELDD